MNSAKRMNGKNLDDGFKSKNFAYCFLLKKNCLAYCSIESYDDGAIVDRTSFERGSSKNFTKFCCRPTLPACDESFIPDNKLGTLYFF